MPLRLDESWIWDFWLARDGADYHVFYLQAPRTLVDPELRHFSASIGHAVSRDLRRWEVLPDAVHAGSPDEWDGNAVWTGSVIKRDQTWYMLYTGVSSGEGGTIEQGIGLATSPDLVHWHKHPKNPLIAADSRYYSIRDSGLLGPERVWRDPWVFRHPLTGEYHALITARARGDAGSKEGAEGKEASLDGRGVIGHAKSRDLENWQTLPPLTEPGDFYCLEVPQLVLLDKRYYLFFSARAEFHSHARRTQTGLEAVSGTHYLVADDPLGPFRYSTHDFMLGDPSGSLYSGKFVEEPDGTRSLLAWRNFTDDGIFAGELDDPLPIATDHKGDLFVART